MENNPTLIIIIEMSYSFYNLERQFRERLWLSEIVICPSVNIIISQLLAEKDPKELFTINKLIYQNKILNPLNIDDFN